MNSLKVITVFGTRPEAIKMAPLVNELKKNKNIELFVCVTAQHRQMLDQVLEIFDIKPDFDLNIMKDSQSLVDITSNALIGLSEVFEKVKPDIVLVHGDTTTTFVSSLAAFYKEIPVAHVEAGLRTFDKYSPFPEEINRCLTGVLSNIHFAPTKKNKENLLNELISKENIYITGNTVIDALKTTVKENYNFSNEKLNNIHYDKKKIILVTAHRRENLGEPLHNICNALRNIVDNFENVEIVYPVHLNPEVKKVANKILGNHNKIHLIEPLDVQDMHNLIYRSYFVMTDSGGIQEEAPSLGKPVLVLRNETERPEAIAAGTVKLAGIEQKNIIASAALLLENKEEYNKMAKAVNPYGDGMASIRIVNALLYHYEIITEKPKEFGAF